MFESRLEQFCSSEFTQKMYGPHPDTRSWIFARGWTRDQLHQTGLDSNTVLTHTEKLITAMEGHSGVPRIDSQFFTSFEIPFE